MVRFSKKIGPGEECTGPKLFWPEDYKAFASSKLCEFISSDISPAGNPRLLPSSGRSSAWDQNLIFKDEDEDDNDNSDEEDEDEDEDDGVNDGNEVDAGDN